MQTLFENEFIYELTQDQIKANEIEKITNNSKTDGLTPDKGVATPSLVVKARNDLFKLWW